MIKSYEFYLFLALFFISIVFVIRYTFLLTKRVSLSCLLLKANDLLLKIRKEHGEKYCIAQNIEIFQLQINDERNNVFHLKKAEFNKKIERWERNCEIIEDWLLRPDVYFTKKIDYFLPEQGPSEKQ